MYYLWFVIYIHHTSSNHFKNAYTNSKKKTEQSKGRHVF